LVIFPLLIWKWFTSDRHDKDEDTGIILENLNIYTVEVTKKMKEDQIAPIISCSFELMEQCKTVTESEIAELNVLLAQIPKQAKEKCQKHVFLKNIVLIYSHMMNLQMIDPSLKKSFAHIRATIPKILEFATSKMLELIILYHHDQFKQEIPINNVYLFIEFTKKFLNRVYTDNMLEMFTEEISMDTIDLLKSKNYTLKNLENNADRTKAFSKLKIAENEAEIIHNYFDGLPKFKIEAPEVYVEGHENIEAGDVVCLDFKLSLENFENPLVVSNMQRKSFNYPGQEERIIKTPCLYAIIMEKSKNGKVLNVGKVPFTQFSIEEEKAQGDKVKNSITLKMRMMFPEPGEKKLVLKVLNDSYFAVDANLEVPFRVKVNEKKEEVEKVQDGDESIEGSEDSDRVVDADEDEMDFDQVDAQARKKNK